MTQPVRETTRWNLAISRDTDIAVRTYLARTGFKKGDLSNFVEMAVRWRVFDQTVQESRLGFADLAEAEAESLLDEALQGIRAEMLAEGKLNDFLPGKG
ncbi:MAG: ribbon-helix-helix domain-containing protein [Betaproteobacteria bacterium]|nr:ribbon-helix-helix domain-containing protein [Betaproteobacteria bacterium]